MSSDRREFIKKSLLVLGGVATGAAASKALGSAVAASATAGTGPMVPAMTADGRMVQVLAHSAAPKSNAAVRQGVPGRKWVMVIDLAGCDGCKTCTKVCGKAHFIPGDREWIRVFKMQDSSETTPYYFPRPCLHCA